MKTLLTISTIGAVLLPSTPGAVTTLSNLAKNADFGATVAPDSWFAQSFTIESGASAPAYELESITINAGARTLRGVAPPRRRASPSASPPSLPLHSGVAFGPKIL